MKRIHLYINSLVVWYGLLLTGCTGCTSGVVEVEVPVVPQPIELSFNRPDLGLPVETRAATDPVFLPKGATVRIAAYLRRESSGGSGTTSDVAFPTTPPTAEATYEIGDNGTLSPCPVDNNGIKSAGTAKGISVLSGTYDFYALSPARALTERVPGRWQTSDIPQKEDIMTSLSRGRKIVPSQRTVTLETFQRQCALIVFTIAPSAKNAVPLTSLKGTALKLTGVSRTGASMIAGEAIPATLAVGPDENDSLKFVASEFIPVSAISDPDCLGLNQVLGEVLPKTAVPFDVAITVARNSIEGITLKARIDSPAPIAFEAGKCYVFKLLVENDESLLTFIVLPWNSIYFANPDIGGTPGDRPPGPVIDAGTSIGLTIARWTHIDWADNSVGGK